MQELFKLNNKIIPNLNTSVLCTSDFNSQNDIAFYLKQNIPIITKQEQTSKSPINPELLNELDCLYLTSKTNLTKIDKLKLNIISKLSQEPSCLIFFNILTYSFTISCAFMMYFYHIRPFSLPWAPSTSSSPQMIYFF